MIPNIRTEHFLVSLEIRAVNSQVLAPFTAKRHVKESSKASEDMWVDAAQRKTGYKSLR